MIDSEHTASATKTFSVPDYVVFVGLFAVSCFIGLFFAFKDRKNKTTENYLLAGRSMSGWPVALSLTASFMSAITVLGTPSEIYTYGTMFWWFFVAYTFVTVIVANVFVPVFYNMGISSTYEFLEKRFSRPVRITGTCVFILQTVLYTGMVMYMPALALNKVTGLSLYVSIVGTALVCTFYTCIGGMKAVVWNDVIQCVVMWIGFTAIIVKGSINAGGIREVFDIAYDGGRIIFFQFDFDPRIRHSFWSIIIGGSLMWLSVYGVNQAMVQRYLSCSSLKQAKLSLYLNNIGLFIVLSLACICGLVMYAVYHTCDPLTAGHVTKSDQLVPYLVMDILSVAPGIPGVFVASAYSGTLSTVAAGINAMACASFEDLVKPCLPRLSASRSVAVSKILVVFYGLMCLGVAFLASLMDQILTMALKIFGIIGGPMLGVFCLGLFTTIANSTGALVGLCGGLVVGFWIAIGSYLYPIPDIFINTLPVASAGCNMTSINTTAASLSVEATSIQTFSGIHSLYALSYCHYSTFLVAVTFVLGSVVSMLSGGIKSRKSVDLELLAFPRRWLSSNNQQHGAEYSAGNRETALNGKASPKNNRLDGLL